MRSPNPVSTPVDRVDDRQGRAGPGPIDPPLAVDVGESRLGRGATLVAWAGYLVYGIPAVLAVPAFVLTVSRFGAWPAVTDALPSALTVMTPLLAWSVYTVRRRRHLALSWLLVTAAACTLLLITPLFFWAGPALSVVTLEIVRLLATRRRRRDVAQRSWSES